MIAAIYSRKSTDDSDRNAEARSTARQIDHATAYARAKGWTVDPRYIFVDENISGAEWTNRPGLNALLAALEPRPPFGVVIVSELSRLGRDSVRTPLVVTQVEEAGVEIHSYLSDARISLADETSEVSTIFGSLAASFERRRVRQRTYDALRRRAEAGAVTGNRVFGYRNVRQGNGYVFREVVEAEAVIVRRIFQLYLQGSGHIAIAKALNAERVPAPRTGSWAPSGVREILRRPLYAGRPTWNKAQRITRRGTKARRGRPATEWVQGEGEVPGLRIVSDELWAAVERRRARAASSCPSTTRDGQRRGRPLGADLRSRSLLSGLAHCATCGASLVALTRMHGRAPNRQNVALYGCGAFQKRGRTVCGNDVKIRQERLDGVFLDALAQALDEKVIARAVTLALERLQRRGAEAPDRRAALRREREEIATAIRHLLDAVKTGRATETLLAELATQEARGKALDRELEALTITPRAAAAEGTRLATRLRALSRDVRGVLASGGPEARLVLQRLLGGQRVACMPFREPGRRGYRFRATGAYAGLSNDMRDRDWTPALFIA